MNSTDPRKRRVSPWYKVSRIVVYGAGAVLLLFYLAGPQRFGGSARDWLFLAVGVALAVSIVSDIGTGATMLTIGSDYTRSKSPVGFWVSIAIQAIFAIGCVTATLGDITGLWKV
jgi:hypothetical protein